MMIMPNEESEWVHQVFRYIHSPTLFIRGDNSDFEAEEKREQIVKMFWQIENLICRFGRMVC